MKDRPAVVLTFLAAFASMAAVSEAQWRHVGGPEGGRVTGLAVNGKRIYATSGNTALFMSEDNGGSWRVVKYELPQGRIQAADGQTLYAGDTKYGLRRSTDGGSRWERFGCPCPKDFVNDHRGLIAISAKDIYAACDGEVHRTSDGGKTWIKIAPGWPSGGSITMMAADSGTIGVIVTAPLPGDPPDFSRPWEKHDLYLSCDDGKTWEHIRAGWTVGQWVASLAIGGKALYVGLYEEGLVTTEDAGATWIKAGPSLPKDLSFYALAVKGHDVFAGTGRGVFRSKDKGKRWSAVNTGLTNVAVESLVERGGTLVAGSDRGIFLSEDGGLSWRAAHRGLPEGSEIIGLTNAGPDLFAATHEHGIFTSSDGGRTWESAIPAFLEKANVNCLAPSGDDLIVGTDDGVFRSVKGRGNWEPLKDGLPASYVDGLASWAGKLVAVTAYRGAFMSSDAGAHWEAVKGGYPGPSDIYSLTVSGGALYAGTVTGVFVLNDEGTRWTAVNTGLPEDPNATCLAAQGSVIAAGTDDGVFITLDKGAHWKSSGTGLPGSVAILSLLFKGNYLFAGTETGVWRLPLPGASAKDK